MICMKRGIWAQTQQWVTANVNCLSWTDRSFWRQPWATNCFIACCSKALWLLVSHSIHRITWVFWFYYLWLLDWNLQPTSTKQTPLSKVINKVRNQISFAMFLLAQRKKCFLLTSYSYSGYGVFALIFITPSLSLFCVCVCATSPVECSMYFQSFCCAFIIHTGLMESICYTLTQISPNDICSWFSFSLHCTENVYFEGKCFNTNIRTRRTLKPLPATK